MISVIRIFAIPALVMVVGVAVAQSSVPGDGLVLIKSAGYTSIKDQANTGTCWSFSVTSLIESQSLKRGLGEFDLSEMYTVRNIYVEKARNYLLRQGAAQFGPGGLGHDVIYAYANYGAMPESVYSGLTLGEKRHDHSKLDARLKLYLDSLLAKRPIPADWLKGFQRILDDHLGKPPEVFRYREKQYTAKTFASEVLHFNPGDYVGITSFSHHPFYEPFVLEIPDNYLNGSYFNIPLEEMMSLAERALGEGYTLMWDADVSNQDFRQDQGFAMEWKDRKHGSSVDPDDEEIPYDQGLRQQRFENLTTEDDHLMHMVGLEKSAHGKKFFLVKNSWGKVGPYDGLIHASEAYVAINTISLVVPKGVLDEALKKKLGLKE